MEIFFTILIMTLVVSLSGVVTRVLPFQVPLPLIQIAIGALLQIWPPGSPGRPDIWILIIAFIGLTLTTINMFGGFAVTRRMLAMFQK